MKNTTIYIFIGVVLLSIALGAMLFEFKDVPDVSWRQHYLPESKDPHGTWMFKALLEERYGANNVYDRYSEIETTELDSSENHLLIMIGKHINLDWNETESLANYSNAGHDVLLIGENFNFDYNWGVGEIETGVNWDSTIVVSYPELTGAEYDVRFRPSSFDKAQYQQYRYFSSENDSGSDTEDFEVLKKELIDEVLENLEEEDEEDYYSDEEEEDNEEDYYSNEYKEEEEDDNEEESKNIGYGVGFTNSNKIIFKQWDYYPEVIQMHTLPYLFSNIAADSPEFLDHFNKVIGHRDYDKIIIDHPSFNRGKRSESKSPLQFILASRSLKWAYYTLLLGALLYVLFKGKRKQRIVPTLQPNNNTSLEYVQTLGSLYENQNKPRNLVKHLEEIFHHKVKSRYFLDSNDGAFTEKLSKKSNIQIEEIDQIVTTFKTIAGRYDFNHADLSTLYRRLDAFYKNCK